MRTVGLEPGGFVRDMGTPDRLALVERHIARRERAKAARADPKRLRVAFLDRDGTLNREVGLVSKAEQIEMLPGAAEAVGRLTRAGWRCFLITNQPVIARGFCSLEELEAINGVVLAAVEKTGGKIERVYFSPFHPETHHGDGVKELRRGSDCRKPGAGMLFQAEEENGLDLAECVMIGDSWRDMVAGRIAGVRTVFVGEGEVPKEADEAQADLAAAVDKLLRD